MARTFSGILFYDASQINFTGTATYTRNGLGDLSVNQAASLTVQYQMGCADVKRPFFSFNAFPGQGTVPLSNELQEVFGTAAGGPGNPLGPGFSGTPAIPWGISVVDIFACYAVGTLALTSATLGLSRINYVENTAISITALIAATATATSVTAAANACHIGKVAAATPLVFETVDFSDLLLELVLVTPATSTARVYGLGMHVAVEYS